MLDEIKDLKGAIDNPDSRDYVATHLLGEPEMELPASVNLDVVPSHNQGSSMHCTSYALVHVVEILNTLEHNMAALADPEEQWANQKYNRGGSERMEKEGDSLQNAMQAYMQYGLSNKALALKIDKYRPDGYARVEKTKESLKKWLVRGFPIFTGSINHAFALIGYNDVDQVFIAKNSYGPKYGRKKDGTFNVDYAEVVSKLFTPYIIYDKKDIPLIFRDVSENSPMAADIKFCLEKGLMQGYGTDPDPAKRFFKPDQPITRAELASVAAKLYKALYSIRNAP